MGEPLPEGAGDPAAEEAEVGADARSEEAAVGWWDDAQALSALEPRMPMAAKPAALVLIFTS
jgi:hypothetical protein